MERKDELRSDEVIRGAEELLKSGKLEPSSTTEFLLPLNVEYPMCFKIRDLLKENGYILADQSGRKTPAEEEAVAYGLLLEPDLPLTDSRFKQLFRRIFRPSKRWVGVLHCGENDDECLIRIFGKNNVQPLVELSSEISSLIKKPVTPRFSSEREKQESRWFSP